MPERDEYPSNSHIQKEPAPKAEPERPKVEPVVTGRVYHAKKPWYTRTKELFTGDDAHAVGSYVLLDVIVPSVRNLIADTLTTAIERTLFGDGRSVRSRGGSTYGSYSAYNRAYSPRSSTGEPPWRREEEPRQMSRRGRATHDFREIIIDNRQEAAMVLDTLTDMIERYEVATVSDMYDAANMTSEFTDRKWGWTDLRDAQIIRVRTGYLLQMPAPIPLS